MTRKLTFLILALFALIAGPGWGQNYQLVTSTSDLVAGCNYVIGNGYSGSVNFMSTAANNNNRKATADISVSTDGEVTEVTIDNTVLKLELGGTTGAWTLKTTNYLGTNGYLASAASGSNNYCRVIADKTTASISFSDNAAVITIQPHTSRNILRYNSSASCFACYSSGQDAVYLYKEITSSKTLTSLAISGTPTKTEYETGEEFDPAGLVVTGTYDDESTADLTNAADWTFDPATFTSTSQTSVSVTATVGEVESEPYEVNGLTVTEHVQTYANTYTSNVELTTTGGTSASSAKVIWKNVEYNALKCGTGSAAGACVVTIPANTQTLHFHAAGWNGETVVLNETFNLVADGGVSNSSPFTLRNDPKTNDYFTLDPQGATSITFTATSGNRFVLFGVNAEISVASVATPTFTPAAGTYDEPQNVTIECETEGAAIYYTTDGTDPTEDSYLYISAIEIDETTTIKAIAYLNGEASDIATAEYEIVELYTITVDPSVFGEVTTYPADRAAAGTEVTIIISSIEEHYHVKEIHVYDGYAQEINVDDNGKFIMPESLVGVSVIFEEDQQCNISYYCNGSFDEYETVYAGPIDELREPSGSIPEGFTFAGWSTSMASITAITGTYNVSEDTDLFAIFAKVEGGSGEATATLTNSDITGSSLTNTYGDFSITNTYGTWSGNGCKQGNFSGDGMYFLQLRNNSTVSYLKLPVFPGNITSIVCEQVCNTTKDRYTGDIYFRTEADNNADAIVTATSNDALDNVTLNIPSGYNTGYIMVSAACRIYSFTVTYQSGVTKYYTRVFQDETAFEDITIEGPSIIPTGSTLNMDTYTLTSENPANLVIEDGAQLIHHNAGVTATVQKNITGYGEDNVQTRDGYYLIANPTERVQNDVYDALDGCAQFDLYTFDPTVALEWVNKGSTDHKVLFERNVGYLYANAQDMALHFRGYLLPTNVTTDIDLVYYEGEEGDGREFPGFNLIGNPYTCDAYISGGYFHFYKMVEGELQLAATSVAIAPCEGFFVEATGTDLSISISTVAPEPASTLNLTVSQNRGNVIDRAIVRFDGANDLHKFMLNPAHTNLSIAKGGETFAAISTEAEGELPVNFKAEKNGTYTISVNTENVEANYLHLIDNLTGMDTDLLSTPSYTFDATTRDYASRFKLVFGVKNDNEEMSQASSFAYINNGEIVISNEGRATLQVIDVLGRIVSSEEINGECRISTNGLTAGLYILNLNGNVQKIVVR